MKDFILLSFLLVNIIVTTIISIVHFLLLLTIKDSNPAKSKELKSRYKDTLKLSLAGFVFWFAFKML